MEEKSKDKTEELTEESTEEATEGETKKEVDENKEAISDDGEKKSVKPGKRRKWHLYVMLCICIAAVIACAIGLGRELYLGWQSKSYYASLSSGIETRPRVPRTPGVSSAPSAASRPSGDATPGGDDHGDDFIGLEYIYEEEPWEPYVDFEALDERFPGIKAWIMLEGTDLDYPLMQTNNNYFYLGHLPDGTRQRSGSIFLDFRNKEDFSDKNILIYGHESRTGEMFGSLKNYRNQAFYEANPIMYIFTPEKDYQLVLIAGYLLDSGVEVPPMRFSNDDAFLAHISDIKRRSFFKTNVEVGPDDQIVSLCTCAYDYTNARFIVVGKLIEF